MDEVEEFLSANTRYVQMQRNVLDQAYKWAARNRLLTWNPAVLACRSDHGQVLTAEQAARYRLVGVVGMRCGQPCSVQDLDQGKR